MNLAINCIKACKTQIMEELDPVPALVHKDVDVSVHRIPADLVPYQTAQRVEALSHIRRLAV